MAILEVNNLKKVYTTRLGGNQVEALKNLSFSVEEGEYVAIMGESGSGKTTLLNMLAALDKPTEGEVYLDGKPLSAIREKDLSKFRRDHLGFVFQDFNLLDTFNLKDNILLPLVLQGVDYRKMNVRMMPIVKELGIAGLLEKYPYEVSGGQKQRICIARAILKKPKVLILDDSTSAVDTATEGKIRNALAKKLPDMTKIIIAQRISSVCHADQIIIMDGGRVDAIGTHESLLKTNKIYQEIYESQKEGADL